MLFEVDHLIRYTYDRPVFLEPHTVRLRPGTSLGQFVMDASLAIEPTPAGLNEIEDPDGNIITQAWFDGLIDRLELRSTATVETLRANPFDFVVLEPVSLPVLSDDPRLAAGTTWSCDAQVGAFAAEVAEAVDGDAQAFLGELVQRTSAFERFVRETGDPFPAAETLRARAGSCRDLTVLAMDACRAQGLAARFVSGYHEPDPAEPEQHMHAWLEVYLPGAGWRGFDPTFGLAVADRHVWVARAPVPALAAPTSGSFRGTGVTAAMTVELTVRAR